MAGRISILHWSRDEDGWRRRVQFSSVAGGMIWGMAVTLLCGLVLGLWVFFSGQVQYHLSGIIVACVLAGAFSGGVAGGLFARSQGWLHGGLAGTGYGILFFIAVIIGGWSPMQNPLMLLMLPLFIAAGLLGGVAGVNTAVFNMVRKNRYRQRGF